MPQKCPKCLKGSRGNLPGENQSNPLRKGPQRGQRGHKALKGTHKNGVNASQEEWGIHGTYETWSRAIGIPKDSLETRHEPAKPVMKKG